MDVRDPRGRYDALAAGYLAEPGFALKRAFASEALTIDGKIFAMLKDERLVVKLPRERCQELLADGTGQEFGSGGRVMREWVSVGDEADWDALAEEALAFVRP